MSTPEAFLDTSVILSRKFGVPKEKASVKKAIGNRQKSSTKYIKVEINRTFLTDAIFLHYLLVEEGDLRVVYQRLRRYPTTQRKRDRCLAILESVSDKRQTRFSDAITRLQNLILGMEKALLRDVRMIDSGTNCPLADKKLEFVYPIFEIETSCTRKKPACSLPQYLQKNIKKLQTLNQGISSDEKLKKLHKTLGIVLQNPKKGKGRNCQILGDTIICLDAPENCDIFSTNTKDFGPICKHLGKSFVVVKW